VNVSANHSLFPPNEYREMMGKGGKSADLGAKFFFSMGFFLQNSTARWLFRGTDDTVINFERLPEYIFSLEERFDPEKDFVFRGNCVHFVWDFPQGGSGYLLSRAAVRTMEPHGRRFIRTMKWTEDMTFKSFLKTFGVKMFDVTDEAFCGHYFGDKIMANVVARRYDSFKPCPDPAKIEKTECRPYVSPVNRIVFYHEWAGRGLLGFAHGRSLFSSAPILGWWTPKSQTAPKMCRFVE
jgi:hypothetical protein